MRKTESGSRKRLRSFLVDVDYLLKEYKTSQAIDENDKAILRFVHPPNTTHQ